MWRFKFVINKYMTSCFIIYLLHLIILRLFNEENYDKVDTCYARIKKEYMKIYKVIPRRKIE
jgi:hypothetical protein